MNRVFSFFRAVWQILCNIAVGPVMPPLPDPISEPDWEDEEELDDDCCQMCERCTSYDPCCNCDEAECGLCDPCIPGPLPEEEPEPVPVRDCCVDMSNWWLGGPVTDEIARIMMINIKKQGYTGVIAGTQIPSIGNQQVKAAQEAEMWTDGYHYVKFDQDYLQNVAQAEYAFEDVKDKIGILWLDLEETPPDNMRENGAAGGVLNFIALMVEELEERGFLVGIYTRRSWWVEFVNNSAFFDYLPLWCTDYNNPPPYDAAWWEHNHFGGWDAPIWVQFEPDVNVAGVNVDLNERFVA